MRRFLNKKILKRSCAAIFNKILLPHKLFAEEQVPMAPENYLLKRLILPDLKLNRIDKFSNQTFHYHCSKTTEWEVCLKCPTKSYSVHDHRGITIGDAKLRAKHVKLIIT